MGILRDRMIEEMKLRNFSPATQESYAYAVRRLAKYHNKSPDQLSKGDMRVFLVHIRLSSGGRADLEQFTDVPKFLLKTGAALFA